MKGTENDEELREELIQLKSRINEMEKALNNCNKMEIALKKSEERFRAFAESATDGIVTTDVYGNILFFNNSFKNIFGYSSDELEGESLTIVMPDSFKPFYLNELERFRSTGEFGMIGRTVEETALKKDASEIPIEMSISTWKSGDENYVAGIIRDITKRKEAEEEREKTEEKYRYIVEKVLKVSNEILQVMNKP